MFTPVLAFGQGRGFDIRMMDQCVMNYAKFDSAKLTKVRICSTELGESNFAQCHRKEIVWDRVALLQASFFKTPLKGMDFTTCVIDGLILSDECGELKGAVVEVNQAVELAKRLGVVVKQRAAVIRLNSQG